MQTKCLNCGKVLTSEKGRLAPAIADSSLPHKPMEEDVTWLRCEECHAVAVRSSADALVARLKIIDSPQVT